MQTIKLRHNIETAHRLSLLPGKCQQIHGHSWWIELEIMGKVDQSGILLEFGKCKADFRKWLDDNYDHRLMLNADDPILMPPITKNYPGVKITPADPTTENLARWVGEWAQQTFGREYGYCVTVWETSVNCATWRADATS